MSNNLSKPTRIKVIGDDIYIDSQLVGKITVSTSTLRDRFVETIDGKVVITKTYSEYC